MTVSDLTQGAEHLFTVAGIDVGGRVGESSNSSTIVKLDSECQSKWSVPINGLSALCEYVCMLTPNSTV